MPDSVRFSFGEGAIANNDDDDDDAAIAVEIFAKDGVCVDGARWTLTVAGDT